MPNARKKSQWQMQRHRPFRVFTKNPVHRQMRPRNPIIIALLPKILGCRPPRLGHVSYIQHLRDQAHGARCIRLILASGWWLGSAVAFSAEINLPEHPVDQEIRAVSELARVWLSATGDPASIRDVPTNGGAADPEKPRFFLGDTPFTRTAAPLPVGADRDGFRVVIRNDGTVVLHGQTPVATAYAVNWFCSHELNARWFFPGELGEVIPHGSWAPHEINLFVQPAFRSRELSGLGTNGELWALHNGLNARWPHAHALLHIISPSEFNLHPDWFPVIGRQRYRPIDANDYNWQPNLANPAVAMQAAQYAERFFQTNPTAEAVSLSVNDSINFDQSPETLAARGPLRWFRNRPNYSDLVFSFMNRVADLTSTELHGKYLSAYAYYWCEDTPTFPIRPAILPWLTADRAQWYDPVFASQDQRLIRRWCQSGAATVGCYDYLYGSPFLIPRVTTHLTAESIRFEFNAGVRAFFAEANANWAIDGPKLWVVTQLLWDPSRDTDTLLSEYFQTLFGEAAPPMAAFYGLCEDCWNSQPGPARWIKYYQDPAQAELFPPPVRTRLRELLARAAALTRDPLAARRVALVATAFESTDDFCSFFEARKALKEAQTPKLYLEYLSRRRRFADANSRAVSAGAIAATDLSVFLRDDPGANLTAEVTAAAWQPVPLADAIWSEFVPPSHLDDTTFLWNNGAWLGRGEPTPSRTIRIITRSDGTRIVRFEHTAFDHLTQWIPAVPGALYRAQVDFVGRVGPGNEQYLIASFRDHSGRFVGDSAEDRVPWGEWRDLRHLTIILRAPATANEIGFGIYSCHQLADDFSEFSAPKLMLAR